jgi:hypothetical protein
MAMNAQDLCAIQECLIAYKKLLDWLPTLDELEVEMKADRIDIINHLVKVCGGELNKISEEYRKEA